MNSDEPPDVIWSDGVYTAPTDKEIALTIYNQLKNSGIRYQYNVLLGNQKSSWYKIGSKSEKDIAKIIIYQLKDPKVKYELNILDRKYKLKKINKS